jgi:hypothetical protein
LIFRAFVLQACCRHEQNCPRIPSACKTESATLKTKSPARTSRAGQPGSAERDIQAKSVRWGMATRCNAPFRAAGLHGELARAGRHSGSCARIRDSDGAYIFPRRPASRCQILAMTLRRLSNRKTTSVVACVATDHLNEFYLQEMHTSETVAGILNRVTRSLTASAPSAPPQCLRARIALCRKPPFQSSPRA